MKYTILIALLFLPRIGFGRTATFLSNFEDQNTRAEIGQEHIELYDGDTMYVVANPHPDTFNSSDYVLKVCTNEGSRNRAEYDAWRNVTNEKKYFYTWKRYHPAGMFKDIDMRWGVLNQWKTWPCEVGGTGEYAAYREAISYWDNGGIFNETRLHDTTACFYLSRANPCRRADYYNFPMGNWNHFVLEIYWTTTENGYYRLWRNNSLLGYTDHIKTLFDGFLEGTCNMYWSTGLYVSWAKTGGRTQDTLAAYIDDIAIYDADSFAIDDICSDCEAARVVSKGDSNIYKINMYGLFSSDGYNNYVQRYNRDPFMYNLSNTFGQSSDIDIFIPDFQGNERSSHSDECFPSDVINSYVNWYDAATHPIEFKGLNPDNTYTVKVLSAGIISGQGIQIWTTEANRDTVLSYHNTCAMAELTDLVSDNNRDLTINVSAINVGYPRPCLNAIEIIEYTLNTQNRTSIRNPNHNLVNVVPNPAIDYLFIEGTSVPCNVTIYSCDGKRVKYAENSNIITISNLKTGMYIVSVNMENSLTTKRIIKE